MAFDPLALLDVRLRPLSPRAVSPHVLRDHDGLPADYIVSSESVSADALGFTNFVDIAPGQAVIITRAGGPETRSMRFPLESLLPTFLNTSISLDRILSSMALASIDQEWQWAMLWESKSNVEGWM